jgi:hypothetical protein
MKGWNLPTRMHGQQNIKYVSLPGSRVVNSIIIIIIIIIITYTYPPLSSVFILTFFPSFV